MKTILLFLFAATCAATLSAASPARKPTPFFGEVPVAKIPAQLHASGEFVTVGTTRVVVATGIGSPDYVLPDGSWLYANYRVRLSPQHVSRPATLVVRFANNCVSRMTMADEPTTVALRAMPPHRTTDKAFAVADARH